MDTYQKHQFYTDRLRFSSVGYIMHGVSGPYSTPSNIAVIYDKKIPFILLCHFHYAITKNFIGRLWILRYNPLSDTSTELLCTITAIIRILYNSISSDWFHSSTYSIHQCCLRITQIQMFSYSLYSRNNDWLIDHINTIPDQNQSWCPIYSNHLYA